MFAGIHITEVLLFAVVALHIYICPGTKVEESFNIQAVHDLIYHSWNVSAYDHHKFPGVVPRTFAGPAYLAFFGYPAKLVFHYFNIPKYFMQGFIRLVLGFTVVFTLCKLGRTLGKWYGGVSATAFRIITVTQFHFLFYASRTLPNTFALPFVILTYQRILDNRYYSAVKWATVAVVLFRCELILLFGPIFIFAWLYKHLIFFDLEGNGAIFVGIKVALQVLFSTIPLDCLLWERPLYPELEVAWFNIIENRSHEYGVSPFLWYFYSALPRCMLSTLLIAPVGIFFDRTSRQLVIPPLIFVFLYSFLPHKELRFILYVVPSLNAAAAIVMSKIYYKGGESIIWKLVSYGCWIALLANVIVTAGFSRSSMENYPAYYALKSLQIAQKGNSMRPISLHIDIVTAQTGATRFMQLYDAWEYSKEENLSPKAYKRFDFLMVGTYKNDLEQLFKHDNFTVTHQPWLLTKGFSHIEWSKTNLYKLSLPSIVLKERVAILKRR